jgi:hypothetical protein
MPRFAVACIQPQCDKPSSHPDAGYGAAEPSPQGDQMSDTEQHEQDESGTGEPEAEGRDQAADVAEELKAHEDEIEEGEGQDV